MFLTKFLTSPVPTQIPDAQQDQNIIDSQIPDAEQDQGIVNSPNDLFGQIERCLKTENVVSNVDYLRRVINNTDYNQQTQIRICN